jgi:DNA processing protein
VQELLERYWGPAASHRAILGAHTKQLSDRRGTEMDDGISCGSVKGLLVLMALPRVGPRTACRLARRFPTIRDVVNADRNDLGEIATSAAIEAIGDQQQWAQAHDTANERLESAEAHGIRLISSFDLSYPELLRAIPDAPPVLYCKGELRLGKRYVACVGTRKPSEFGRKVAQQLSAILAEHGFYVVTGLARGIDTESHEAALRVGGHTVAILANGLDTVCPRENQCLADRILETRGVLVSEQPIGARARPHSLIQACRLQSGLSGAVFVIQTDVDGGTMHTVRSALFQDRLLFAPVPPQMFADENQNRGIRALVEQAGPQFANTISADSRYRDLLTTRYAGHAPAIPIHIPDDYDAVLGRLHAASSA